MTSLFFRLLRREWLLAQRFPSEYLNPLAFFVLVIMLFPLTLNSGLQDWGVGVIWVAAILSSLMSFDSLFNEDFRDGTLDQWLLSGQPISLIALMRVIVHWFFTGFALIVVSPLLGIMIGLNTHQILNLLIGLLLGTPIFSLIGGVMAALTLGLRQGGVLLSLLILPLIIPVLIFGASLVSLNDTGVPILGHVALLSAMLILTLTLAPFAIGAALKLSVE